jgi:ethanolamine utilization protein EutM
MPKALGLVETRGLVAAIEAADAMVKAANVTLIGKERTDPALITIKVVGETAAVRSSVDAGAAAARRVGVLVSTHIIPQPDIQMISLLPEIDDGNIPAKKEKSEEEKVKTVLDTKPVVEKPVRVKERKITIPKIKVEESEIEENIPLDSNTISRLRKEALGIEEEKTVSTSKIKSNLNISELEILNVHQLRRLARSTEGFPIQGREISRANRNELMDHFKKLL